MKMKKIIALILFILVLVSGCGEKGIPSQDIQDENNLRLARENLDSTRCQYIQNEFIKNQCYIDMSIAKKEWALCSKISDKDNRNYCLQETYCKHLEGLNECRIVGIGPVEKMECYINLSISSNDIMVCECAGNKGNIISCYYRYTIAKGDISLCEEYLSGYYIGRCIGEIAAQEKNPAHCEKIEIEMGKDECLRTIAHMMPNPIEVCGQIKDARTRYACLIYSANIPQNISLCDTYSPDDTCYSNVAIATNDSTACGKIKDEMKKDSCYYRIADKRADIEICDEIKKLEIRDDCYLRISVGT